MFPMDFFFFSLPPPRQMKHDMQALARAQFAEANKQHIALKVRTAPFLPSARPFSLCFSAVSRCPEVVVRACVRACLRIVDA